MLNVLSSHRLNLFFATNSLWELLQAEYLLLDIVFLQYSLPVISSYHQNINSSDSVMRAHGIDSSGCLNIFATRGHPISVRYPLMPSE